MNTPPSASNSAMTLAEALAAAEAIMELRAPLLGVFESQADRLLATTTRIERLGRWVDALRVAAAAEIDALSGPERGSDGLAARLGCRNTNELLQRVTHISGSSAARRLTLGAQTRARATITGSSRPPAFASVAAAMRTGEIGVDSASAIVSGLSPVIGSSNPELWLGAEHELVQAATGGNPDELNLNRDADAAQTRDPRDRDCEPCSADETKLQAALWRAALDPDGIEPAEARALRRRSFRIGRETDGMVPVSGQLVPIAAAMLTKVFDAHSNPRTAPAFLSSEEISAEEISAEEISERELTADPRSRPQQHHDILVGIIDAAARSATTPSLGGAAPTVLVTVRKRDVKASAPENTFDPASACTPAEAGSGRAGFGFVEGAEFPISMKAVRQLICSGGTQEVVLSDAGRIVALGSAQRCFTAPQRRAITVRDGGCLIPGCSVPAAWCEIHHVIEAARGGPTHPDNGVLLCWFHHRTIETSGRQIRTMEGVPQIKAPPWIRVDAPWRSSTKSPTRIVDRISDAVTA